MSHPSGIYKIENSVTGKVYIGSAVNLLARKRCHFSSLKHGNHKNSKLQRSYDKHGKKAFGFDVLLYCDKDNLLMYEQIAIDAMDPVSNGYNIKPIAGSTVGHKHTDETRKKLKEAWIGRVLPPLSDEARANIAKAKLGKKRKPFSEETRRNMSNAKAGIPQGPHSEETKKKIAEALKGREPVRHPPDVLEKIRLKHVGAKRSDQARANMRAGWERKRLEKQMMEKQP